jgi:hydroxymethylpyrimidine/phosphomethylpyrimidine kinase
MDSAAVQPVVLSIAGFDPSSGAGVTADIKTLAAHGCYGVCCVTAITVQSTTGVRRVEPLGAKLVGETLECLADDLEIAAVRIGMLGSGEVVEAVARFLAKNQMKPVVLDPILKSSSGAVLLEGAAVKALVAQLLPLCTVVTPNLGEAAELTGLQVTNLAEMREAALRLHELGAPNVVITGGHLASPTDLLSMKRDDGKTTQQEFPGDKIASCSIHGTGCAFATSLAANLALRRALPDAVQHAKQYVAAAIAGSHPLGRGVGPIHHLFADEKTRG